ncbi:MAG: ferredoxin-thioredoxin reductase catalytic domain-containing protein [Methanosarcinaceae archaeon]|nr:ferredoxin-thioredoxin reductase catalytic domain-containing protein [Methanosarcinaceae archaeon]
MEFSNDIESEIYALAKENAEESGYKLNPDYDIVVTAIKAIANNKRDKGEPYCGCRSTTGNKVKDKELICPCSQRDKDIAKRGACLCALYVA